jgi:streptogramin lyase
MKRMRSWSWPAAASSLLLLAACQDRLFDNPLDPSVSEVVFEVVQTITGPAAAPRGLAWDGATLWLADGAGSVLYSLNPASGAVVRALRPPAPGLSDAAYDGADLWACGEADVFLLKIGFLAGDVLKRLNMQRGSFTALEYGRGALWAADAQSNKILRVDPETGEVLGSFGNPGTLITGLAFD